MKLWYLCSNRMIWRFVCRGLCSFGLANDLKLFERQTTTWRSFYYLNIHYTYMAMNVVCLAVNVEMIIIRIKRLVFLFILEVWYCPMYVHQCSRFLRRATECIVVWPVSAVARVSWELSKVGVYYSQIIWIRWNIELLSILNYFFVIR